MTNKKEMTAPCVSVGADTEQSIQKYTTNIIPDVSAEINEKFLKGGRCGWQNLKSSIWTRFPLRK